MSSTFTIDRLAASQLGVLTRAQLVALGMSPAAIDHRVRDGRLLGVHAGVYIHPGHDAGWLQRVVAAVLGGGPGTVASHRAAGYLHGLAGVEPCVEITVSSDRSPTLRGVAVHRAVRLDRADTEEQGGVARTRATRTLIDLAAVLKPPALERALDDALSRRLTTCEHLGRRLDALGRQGRRGIATLTGLLEDRAGGRPGAQSEFERRLRAVLVAGGLPPLVAQFEVALPDGTKAYIDLAYPSHLVGIEADSYRHHSSRLDWARDHTRNAALTAIGWRILPVTWDDLGHPSDVVALVARSLNAFRP